MGRMVEVGEGEEELSQLEYKVNVDFAQIL